MEVIPLIMLRCVQPVPSPKLDQWHVLHVVRKTSVLNLLLKSKNVLKVSLTQILVKLPAHSAHLENMKKPVTPVLQILQANNFFMLT